MKIRRIQKLTGDCDMIKEIIYHTEWLIILFIIVVGIIFTNYRFEDVEEQINNLYIQQIRNSNHKCKILNDTIDKKE